MHYALHEKHDFHPWDINISKALNTFLYIALLTQLSDAETSNECALSLSPSSASN